MRSFSISGLILPLSQIFGSASLCSKKPLWSYQGFLAGPSGKRARSSGSVIGSLPPRSAVSVNRAKSSLSTGLLPSNVSSVPIRASSSIPEISNPSLSFFLQAGIVHERRIGIGVSFLLPQCDQITCHVLRVLNRKPQAWHHRHVLYLQFMSVVGAPGVLQIKNERQALLFIIFRPDILLFIRTIRTRAFPSIVHPAHQIVVIVLLSDSRQIRREGSPLHLIAFADGVARQTPARLDQLLSVCRIPRSMFRNRIGEARLPQIRGNRLDLIVVEPEVGHFRCRAEIRRLPEPHRNPVFVQLQANI